MANNALDIPQKRSPDATDKSQQSEQSDNGLSQEKTDHLSAQPGSENALVTALAFATKDNAALKLAQSLVGSMSIVDSKEDREIPVDLRNGNDGTRFNHEIIKARDGSIQPRITDATGPDGSVTQYIYSDNNSVIPSKIITTRQTENGKTVQQERVLDANGNYQFSEYQGDGASRKAIRTETHTNVDARLDGKITYERKPETLQEIIIQLKLGRTRLIDGDLAGAKQHFLDVYESHGGNRANAEKYVNCLINDNHKRAETNKDGRKVCREASDDQIAACLRNLTSVYVDKDGKDVVRTGAAAKFTRGEVNGHVLRALKSLGDPEYYNNQGGVGSCTMNSYLFMAEKLYPEGVAKTFAKIMNTGSWRGHKYTSQNLNAWEGRDSFNNMMTFAMASTVGRSDCEGFSTQAGYWAFKAMTHGVLRGFEKDKIGPTITMGGDHCQVKQAGLDSKGNVKVVRQNWWMMGREGVVA